MWMCSDLDTNEPPRWDRRYIIRYAPFAARRYSRLIAMVDEEPVFKTRSDHLVCCDCRNGEGIFNDMVSLKDARYRNTDDDSGRMLVEYIDVIPYVESLQTLAKTSLFDFTHG
jgi:hypothetical protein